MSHEMRTETRIDTVNGETVEEYENREMFEILWISKLKGSPAALSGN